MAQKMDVVGIDVSKATLDAYALTSQQARQFANDPAGHQGLVAWLQELGVGVAVRVSVDQEPLRLVNVISRNLPTSKNSALRKWSSRFRIPVSMLRTSIFATTDEFSG